MSGIDFAFGLIIGFAAGALVATVWLQRRQEEHFAALMEQIRCAG
ncbi:hypothetical protein [Stenotrophomonas sp. RG-453]|nr:hypothetical protein [Stenotrophomonas sp. RG-453]